MTPQMQLIRMHNIRLNNLLKARQAVIGILNIYVRGDIFLENPLHETLARLNGQILVRKDAIDSVVSNLPGYSIWIHRRVCCISVEELKAGLIDISLADDGSSILDLETGKIVSKR